MIDIHSHILYGVDDGSESQAMSLEMLRMSVASGVTDIIATPHVNRKGLVPIWSDLQARVEELRRAAAAADIHIAIHLGAEVELNGATMDLLKECKDDRAYCLGGSHYVLIELTDRTRPNIAENMLSTLQLRGYWPVLAHIERFPQLLEEPDRLLGWIEKGILCQCNTGSFTGYFGPKVKERVRTLYQNGVIHLLGSDGHRTAFRTTDIREAHEELERLARKEKRDDLWQTATANAALILKDRVCYPDVPDHWHVKKRGFFSRLFGH